ncbi:MAG: ABC transporter ATP-binding protein [Myxococcota bacterium]
MDAEPIIEARGLARTYRTGATVHRALDGVDLVVRRGEFVALVGPSGSGKSTLLTLVGALERPDAGTLRIGGVAVETLGDDALAALRNRRIGFVFQAFHLLPLLRADENVALPLRYAGWPEVKRLAHARELLAQVGLGDRAHHLPGELSGGQCQRVAIARALAADPELICADEPTGNLDSKAGGEILAILRDLHARGRTIVLVTHDPHVAAAADRRVRLEDGRIVSDDGVQDVPGGGAVFGARGPGPRPGGQG